MAYIKQCVRKAVSALVIDNAPINALSTIVVEDLYRKLEELESHKPTDVIVLMGKNDIFSGGADIKEFEHFRHGQQESRLKLFNLVERLEACRKPVVAYIRQFAYGGGLELALGCHYRVAHQNAKLGLPEVKIGLIPGAQGTQRLPRLIDITKAIDMITSGWPEDAADALKVNLIDKVVSTDGFMFDFAASVARQPYEDRRLSEKPVIISGDVDEIMERYRVNLSRKSRGMDAPLLGLEAVINGARANTFAEGVKIESELVTQAMNSGQARSMQYVFSAEKKAAKLPQSLTHAIPSRIQRIAVVGGGLMGSGITTAFLMFGFPVLLVEADETKLAGAMAKVHELVGQAVSLGRSKAPELATVDLKGWKQGKPGLCGVVMSEDPNGPLATGLSRVDLVVEAVTEDLAVKQAIFSTLDKLCRPGTFLASNTSSLDIDLLASVTSRPPRVCGLHFFTPAYHIRLMEVVQGRATGAVTLATMHGLARRIGKIPLLTGNCFGFCGNRMLLPYLAEAVALLMAPHSHLDPAAIDETLEEYFGMRLGPFKTMDMIGIDVLELVGQAWEESQLRQGLPTDAISHRFRDALHILSEAGRLGRKTGKGWYQYEGVGSKSPETDSSLMELVESYRKNHASSDANSGDIQEMRAPTENWEIVERCIYCLVNEGFKILEENIVSIPEVVDTAWVGAYGWPKSRGGPMFYARTIGYNPLLDRIQHYSKKYEKLSYWQPSKLLVDLVQDCGSLENWPANYKTKSKL